MRKLKGEYRNIPRVVVAGTQGHTKILSPSAAAIFEQLYRHKGEVCNRHDLQAAIEQVTKRRLPKESKIVSMQILKLRRQLDTVNPQQYPNLGQQIIQSVELPRGPSDRKAGKPRMAYKLEVPEDCALVLTDEKYLYSHNTLG